MLLKEKGMSVASRCAFFLKQKKGDSPSPHSAHNKKVFFGQPHCQYAYATTNEIRKIGLEKILLPNLKFEQCAFMTFEKRSFSKVGDNYKNRFRPAGVIPAIMSNSTQVPAITPAPANY